MELRMTFQLNMAQRMTLLQTLGLESEYLETCLVRSETLLRKLRFQAPLRLVRKFADEDQYNSVLDFLVGLFIPAMKPRIFAYYEGEGDRIIEQSPWSDIDRLDRMMVTALTELRALHDELRSAAWQAGRGDYTKPQMTAAWLDLHIRPRFALPRLVEVRAEEREAA
jgi:hypothetical protein